MHIYTLVILILIENTLSIKILLLKTNLNNIEFTNSPVGKNPHKIYNSDSLEGALHKVGDHIL